MNEDLLLMQGVPAVCILRVWMSFACRKRILLFHQKMSVFDACRNYMYLKTRRYTHFSKWKLLNNRRRMETAVQAQ